MYPFFRLITTSYRGLMAPKIQSHEMCETRILCMPWDIDMYMEMNNGRVITLYDLGRFDMALRTGLAKVLKKNRWGLVVAGSSIRYRKRIRMFDTITMRTQVVGYDERWTYIEQSMWVKGEPASSILLRTGITSKGKTIPTENALAELGLSDWQPEPNVWLEEWIKSEALRPWPPLTR